MQEERPIPQRTKYFECSNENYFNKIIYQMYALQNHFVIDIWKQHVTVPRRNIEFLCQNPDFQTKDVNFPKPKNFNGFYKHAALYTTFGETFHNLEDQSAYKNSFSPLLIIGATCNIQNEGQHAMKFCATIMCPRHARPISQFSFNMSSRGSFDNAKWSYHKSEIIRFDLYCLEGVNKVKKQLVYNSRSRKCIAFHDENLLRTLQKARLNEAKIGQFDKHYKEEPLIDYLKNWIQNIELGKVVSKSHFFKPKALLRNSRERIVNLNYQKYIEQTSNHFLNDVFKKDLKDEFICQIKNLNESRGNSFVYKELLEQLNLICPEFETLNSDQKEWLFDTEGISKFEFEDGFYCRMDNSCDKVFLIWKAEKNTHVFRVICTINVLCGSDKTENEPTSLPWPTSSNLSENLRLSITQPVTLFRFKTNLPADFEEIRMNCFKPLANNFVALETTGAFNRLMHSYLKLEDDGTASLLYTNKYESLAVEPLGKDSIRLLNPWEDEPELHEDPIQNMARNLRTPLNDDDEQDVHDKAVEQVILSSNMDPHPICIFEKF